VAKITYVEHDGTEHVVEVRPGLTVMEAAVRGGVPGIEADCGGACACATCRVTIDAAWRDKLDPPSEMETGMLEFAAPAGEGMRLSCQIAVTDALDGMIVTVPESQY
jgi:2Fe-2S ferredoxin